MEHLMTDKCRILRNQTTLGQYNRPQTSLLLVEESICRLTRKSTFYSNQTPQVEVGGNFRLYLPIKSQVKDGDTIEVYGEKYVADIPYKLINHIEVDLKVTKEV